MLTEAMLLEQNKRLREENEELRETVRQLRENASAPVSLPSGLPHVTVAEETVLRALLRRRGHVVTREAIYLALYGGEERVDIKIVDVRVCKLRRKLARTDIEICTSWGRGYYVPGADGQLAENRGLVAESLAA